MIERLAAMEVDVSVPPNARRAWAVAISAVEAVNKYRGGRGDNIMGNALVCCWLLCGRLWIESSDVHIT